MASAETVPPPSVTDAPEDSDQAPAPQTSTLSPRQAPPKNILARPTLGSRKSSGTIIIPRDSPTVEAKDEHYDADDARAMSPRRSSDEIEKMGDDARHALEEQASTLQSNLIEMMDRVDSVKQQHKHLDEGNKFLQSYIGELMSTSKLTTAGVAKPKSKGRPVK